MVHSRTFGFTLPDGGGEFRILAPACDMINHAGDVAHPLLGEFRTSFHLLHSESYRYMIRSSGSGSSG
jgi:hypothetical protein